VSILLRKHSFTHQLEVNVSVFTHYLQLGLFVLRAYCGQDVHALSLRLCRLMREKALPFRR
jgi:hypothetical protein